MRITEITAKLINNYLHHFFYQYTAWFNTTQLAESILSHYQIDQNYEPNDLKLFKTRMRNQLKGLEDARIVLKEEHKSVLNTTRYKYKLNPDVWRKTG